MIRNGYIDFLKGIAMFWVIFAHAIQYGSGMDFFREEMYWENIIFKTIYSFHMPLFISISGYLFYFSMKHNGLIAAIKHRLRLLIPICFSWSFILLGKELLFVSFNKGNLLKSLLVYFVTDFWFLWSIVAAVCCVGIIETIKRKFNMGGVHTLQHLFCFSLRQIAFGLAHTSL